MKKFLLLLILNAAFLILNSFCHAQNKKIDSLLTLLKNDKEDTSKVNHLNALGQKLMYQNPDTAIILSKQALKIITPFQNTEFSSANEGVGSNEIKLLRSYTLNQLGTCYYLKGEYSNALDYYSNALKIGEELKSKKVMASCFGNIGNIYENQADYSKAIDYYLKALKLDEELKNKKGIAAHLGNIGGVFSSQGDYFKALDYYFRALKMDEELGNKNGICGDLINIGVVYHLQGNFLNALDYYQRALSVVKEIGNKTTIAALLGNLGIVYNEQKDFPKALDYDFKALKMNEELGNKYYIAGALCNIGEVYTKTGKFKDAEQYLKKAIALNESIGSMDFLRESERLISKLYDTAGQYKEALFHYKKSIALKDTLFSQENKKQLIRKEMNFEFDKKEAAAKAENEKQQAVAAAESKKQKIIIWSVIGGLCLVIVFAGFIFRSLRITRRQKNIIVLQKNEVSMQKEIVEKQKEKIVDSITYAQRIQQSILMEESEMQKYFSDLFIFFQPKDIVSGDFYWCSKIDNKIIIAAVDCTGHGVPGAFMSMIGNTLLNQIVNEKHITSPSEILRLLNIGVYEALHQEKDGALSDDGMDIALCCIDYKNNEVQYAGAQNPLYILSDGQIEVIPGDIHEIGGGGMIAKIHDPLKKDFTNHVIQIKKDMSIYIFSDGYMDQFGGSDRKKYGSQKFKELLLRSHNLSMQKQKEIFASAHADWKGSTQQIDDILVMGIRI